MNVPVLGAGESEVKISRADGIHFDCLVEQVGILDPGLCEPNGLIIIDRKIEGVVCNRINLGEIHLVIQTEFEIMLLSHNRIVVSSILRIFKNPPVLAGDLWSDIGWNLTRIFGATHSHGY